jgi:hypothetical protein
MNPDDSFEALFVETPEEAWTAKPTQPRFAWVRPPESGDTPVPVVEMGTLDDLDTVARELAAVIEEVQLHR